MWEITKQLLFLRVPCWFHLCYSDLRPLYLYLCYKTDGLDSIGFLVIAIL